jgi:hypothetical protein
MKSVLIGVVAIVCMALFYYTQYKAACWLFPVLGC